MTVAFVDERDDPSLSDAIDESALLELARRALDAERVPSSAEVSIAMIDVGRMTELNERHMGKSGPTDVLAFPLEELTPGQAIAPSDDGPPLHIGDVFICPQVVAGNAANAGVPFQDELALMVVHGLLHLLGYDHVVDSEAEQMEQRERELLATVGVSRP